MITSKVAPFKWPFPPRSQKKPTAPNDSQQSRHAHAWSAGGNRSSKVADIVMVVFWGASIPGFMWLGALVGF